MGKFVRFKCKKCKVEEDIPEEVVHMMDGADMMGDLTVPPRFNCAKCSGLMEPLYYKTYDGREYKYKE